MRPRSRHWGRDDRPVLYVLKRFPRLSETFVLRELLGLEEAGERVLIDSLLPPESQPRHPELDLLRADLRYLPRRPRLREPRVALAHMRVGAAAPLCWLRLAQRARRNGWRRFVQAGLVARRARAAGARHIHAHFVTAAAEVARDAAALARVPFSVTAHAKDIYQRDNAAQLARRVEGAAAIVTISEFNARHLRASLLSHPVVRVPNGMPLAEPAPAPADGPVLCIARLVPKKGVDVVIEALTLLPKDFPNARLELIGEGPLAEELHELARRRGVAERIDWRGFVPSDAVGEALARCALIALPCRVAPDGDRDGIPTVLLEGMARGLPVVSTPVSGIPELVEHGVSGLLVPPDDPKTLARAIARLLRDRDLAARLGAAARTVIADSFDPTESARKLREVFSAHPGDPDLPSLVSRGSRRRAAPRTTRPGSP
jgi:colanic acid/amylovoran biosynthesis glycosyltransferase